MPAATAGLADIGTRNPDPLVVRRRIKHPSQQLAIVGLDLRLPAERDAGVGDPFRQLVPQPLQLTEPEQSWRAGGGNPMVELDPAESLADEAAELTLETAHLAPQLNPGKALVDAAVERLGAPS